MERVRLETSNGGFVCTGTMPAFNQWPEVILWGTRVFQLETKGPEGELTVYTEVFAVALVDHDFVDDKKAGAPSPGRPPVTG